jgi:YesN/AraC family two-component response regulator
MSEQENIYRKPPLGLSPEGRHYRVVIIDDSLVSRQMLRQVLLSVQFIVIEEFDNGGLALEQLRDTRVMPDILFIDVEMPVMDGIELLKALRPSHPQARFIMVTSHSDKKTVDRLIETGIHGFIKKPFDRDAILLRLEKILHP